MRFLPMVLGAVLAGWMLTPACPAPARADARDGGPVPAVAEDAAPSSPAQPGTDAEARDYAQREAESPEAQEFVGGILLWILVFLLFVLLIVDIAQET